MSQTIVTMAVATTLVGLFGGVAITRAQHDHGGGHQPGHHRAAEARGAKCGSSIC